MIAKNHAHKIIDSLVQVPMVLAFVKEKAIIKVMIYWIILKKIVKRNHLNIVFIKFLIYMKEITMHILDAINCHKIQLILFTKSI